MDSLQQIQEVWQGHQPELDSKIDSGKISDLILSKIKQTENKIRRINVLKTVALSLIFGWFIWNVTGLNSSSFLIWISIALMLVSTIITMLIYWKIQFKSSNLNHELSQKEFIENTISQMKNHKRQFIKLYKWFLLILIISINLFYFDLLRESDSYFRLLFHLGMSFFLVLAGVVGFKIRELRFRKEFQPLIDELEIIIK